MGEVRVVDTNVVLGLAIKYDEHHDQSRGFVENFSGDVYIPPTAKDEFDDLEQEIRETLNQEISKHHSDFDEEFGDWEGKLREKHIKYLRDSVLEDKMAAAVFLREWYNKIINRNFVEVDPIFIDEALGDFALEVYEDATKDIGGWKNLAIPWTRGCDSYHSLKDKLLLPDGNDLKICVESHHIAGEMAEPTEIGTADGDFIDHRDGEPHSRRKDIEIKTDLETVVDLR